MLLANPDPRLLADVELAVRDKRPGAEQLRTAILTAHPGAKAPAKPLIDRDAIVRRVAEGTPAQRRRAIRAVITGLHYRADALTAVREALGDEAVEVRRAATQAYGYLTDPAALPALISRVSDADRAVRVSAVLSLRRFAPAVKAIDTLLDVAGKGDPELRRVAASSLGDIKLTAVQLDRMRAIAAAEKDPKVKAQLDAAVLRVEKRGS
jgi:HEAT repeat protein